MQNNSHNEYLEELVDSEHWLVLKAEAEASIRTHQNAVIAPAESEWDFIKKEQHSAAIHAIRQFIQGVEKKVKNNRNKKHPVTIG